jgi:hypothetical protein
MFNLLSNKKFKREIILKSVPKMKMNGKINYLELAQSIATIFNEKIESKVRDFVK